MNNLKTGFIASLVLVSGVSFAEDQYPATNFQPTIVYQDEAYIAKSGSSSSSTAAAPSADSSSAADGQYPAANFQPQVVYNDDNYKHGTSAMGTASSSDVAASAPMSSVAANTAKDGKSDTTTSYWIGLIVMALGGFALYKKSQCAGQCTKSQQTSASASQVGNAGSGGATGVSRYLSRVSGTGVSRYIDRQVKSAAAQAVTGVEKYLRNRR